MQQVRETAVNDSHIGGGLVAKDSKPGKELIKSGPPAIGSLSTFKGCPEK
jgi:hypothetical protein